MADPGSPSSVPDDQPDDPESDRRPPTSVRLTDEFLFRALMDNTADAVYFKDRRCRLLRVSRSMAQRLGISDPNEITGKTDIELFGESFGRRTFVDDSRIMETDEPIIGLVESRQLDGDRVNWTLTSKLPLHDEAGNVVGLMGVTREINELKQAEMNFQHLATHDTLTGLPNRYLMTDRLNQCLVRSERATTSFSVLYVDLDGFKAVNDAHGHDAGDLLLRTVARRLLRSVRASDTVARIGGDEFLVILESTRHGGDVLGVAHKIQRNLARPYTLRRHRVSVTVSIGISSYPEHGRDAEVLLRSADYAMYLVKKQGKNAYLVCPHGLPGPAAAERGVDGGDASS